MGLYSFYLIKPKDDTSTLIKTLKDGYILKDSLSENPNTAIIQFKSKQNLEIIPYLDRVQLRNSATTNVIETYVITDKIKKVVSQKPLIYSYILTLANRKAELNTKYLLPSFCVTQDLTKSKTIQSIYNRLWNNYPLETVDNWAATRLLNKLTINGFTKPCKEMFYSKIPLGQAIEELFNQIDCSYRINGKTATNENKFSPFKLDYNSRKIIDLKIDEMPFINREEEANGSDFIANMEGTFSNGHADEKQQTVYYPSIDGFAQMRGASDDGITLSDENRVIRVNYPIYSIKQLIVHIPIKITLKRKDNSTSESLCTTIGTGTKYLDVDISEFVFEKQTSSVLNSPSKWENTFLPNYGEKEKDKALYYDYKGNIISGFYDSYDLFGIKTVLENIINYIAGESILDNSINVLFIAKNPFIPFLYDGEEKVANSSYDTTEMSSYFYVPDPYAVDNDWEKWMYRVVYKSIIPSQRHRLEKIDAKNININTSTNINQANAVLNIHDAGEKMYFELNRIAENKVILCGKAKNHVECLNVGDQSKDGYVVTEVETTNFNDYSEFKATLVKNFTNININQSIDKEFRPFEISNKGIKSDLYYTEYIMFSTILDETLQINNSMLKDVTWLEMLCGKEETKFIYNPTYVFFKSNEMNGYWCCCPLVANSFANSVEFHFEFLNQISAGNKITKVTSSKYRNQIVKYTNDFGEFSSFEFYFDMYGILYSSVSKNDTLLKDYPMVSDEEYSAWVNYLATSDKFNFYKAIVNDKGIGGKEFKYQKDASEIFSFTYQLMFVPTYGDIENIIVGTCLTSKNNLVMSGESISTIYSSNSEKYSIFNNQKGIGEANGGLSFEASIGVDEKKITIIGDTTGLTSIGLCDSDGNLFLGINAVNGEIPKTIYIYFRNKRA